MKSSLSSLLSYALPLLFLPFFFPPALSQSDLDSALNVAGGTLHFTTASTPASPPCPWIVTIAPGETYDGVSAARSGPIGYYYTGTYVVASTSLFTTVTGPGIIRFKTLKAGAARMDLVLGPWDRKPVFESTEETDAWVSKSFFLETEGTITLEWQVYNHSPGSLNGQLAHFCLLDEISWTEPDADGFLFQLNDGQDDYELVAYAGDAEYITVPATHAGKPVVTIGDNAFINRYQLLGVTLPAGIKGIGASAFANCGSLRTIHLPATLLIIEDDAFSFCERLSNLTLPDNLIAIGEYAFYNTGLQQLNIPASTQSIGASAFAFCKLQAVTFASRQNADLTLGFGCFVGNFQLQTFALPTGITSLPPAMLAIEAEKAPCRNLTLLRIPASVNTVGDDFLSGREDMALFFMGEPPLVDGSLADAGNLADTIIYYQTVHQADWAAQFDANGHWHGYRTQAITGEPLPLPMITAQAEQKVFLGSIAVTIAVNEPLSGDKLKVFYNAAGSEATTETTLTPGQSQGIYQAMGSNQWTVNLTESAMLQAYAVRPVIGDGNYARCSGKAKQFFLRWDECADAIDNHTLQFTVTDPECWGISSEKAAIAGENTLQIDLIPLTDSDKSHTLLQTTLTGPGLLSCWLYWDAGMEINFGLAGSAGQSDNGLLDSEAFPPISLVDWWQDSEVWMRKLIAIPPGTFTVAWSFSSNQNNQRAYLDNVSYTLLADNFGYVINEDGVSVTITAYLDTDYVYPDTLQIPTELAGLSVTALGDYALADNFFSEVILPDSLTVIGRHAFQANYWLAELTLPASLTFLGDGAFADCEDLQHIYFSGPPPLSETGNLGSQATIIFPVGQPGWIDGGSYRGLSAFTIIGDQLPEPVFSRNDVPEDFFNFFNVPFQLSISSDSSLEIRYLFGEQSPTTAQPGLLYETPLALGDDESDQVIITARTFRAGAPCSLPASAYFYNTRELNDILQCPTGLFALSDPMQWQIIEEKDALGTVTNRYLQAGPYEQYLDKPAQLNFLLHYDIVPDIFSFQWQLVADIDNPNTYDAGQFTLDCSGCPYWSNYQQHPGWETTSLTVSTPGEVTGSFRFSDTYAPAPGIASFRLNKIQVGTVKTIPKINILPVSAGEISFLPVDSPPGTEPRPFTGVEEMLPDSLVKLFADAADGYMFLHWQRLNQDTGEYEIISDKSTTTVMIFADDDGDQSENDFIARFEPAVIVQVTLGTGGIWPMIQGDDYAQRQYETAKLVPTGTSLRFLPAAENGYQFIGWSDGVTTLERQLECLENIFLQANFRKCIKSIPAIDLINSLESPEGITFSSGQGDFCELDEDDKITITIIPVFSEYYRYAGWFYNADLEDDIIVDGTSLTATLDWNKTKSFSPRIKFARQAELTAHIAPGQENLGQIELRRNNAQGEIITFNGQTTIWLDTGFNIWAQATAVTGYRFAHWQQTYGDLESTSELQETTFFFANHNHFSMIAHFVQQAALTLETAPGSLGTGTFKVSYLPYQPALLHDVGKTLTIQAIADTGQRFVKWEDDDSTSSSRQITIMPGDNIYRASFVPISNLHLQAKIISTGNAGGGVTAVYQADQGSEYTIIATPLSGYRFVKWEDDDNPSPSRTITPVPAGDTYYIALYQPVVKVSAAVPSGGGQIQGTGQKLWEDFPVTVTAVPRDGYRFDRWVDSEQLPANRTLTADDIVNNAINLQAIFVKQHQVIIQPLPGQSHWGSVAIINDGGATFTYDEASGSYTATVDNGTAISYQALPNEDTDFVRWGWDGSTEPQKKAQVITASRTFNAIFAPLAAINLEIIANQEHWGNVSLSQDGINHPSGSKFRVGSWVQLQAEANDKVRFKQWHDGAVMPVRQHRITAGDKTFTAEFVRTASVTVNLTSNMNDEEPSNMAWKLPWSNWLAPGSTAVFEVTVDDGQPYSLQFLGQAGWELPQLPASELSIAPFAHQEWHLQYRKITTGILTGWLEPLDITAGWRVKANQDTDFPGSQWLRSGENITLEQGEYEIEFKAVIDIFNEETWHRPEVMIVKVDNENEMEVTNAKIQITANGRSHFIGAYSKYVPDLQLTFSPGETSEGAGANATIATLRRLPRTAGGVINRNEAIKVDLSCEQPHTLIFPPSVTIPAQRDAVQFQVGVVDNNVRETDLIIASDEVTVLGRGQIARLHGLISLPEHCNCTGNPSSGNEIFADLAIYDNDGPALLLVCNPSTLQEPEPGHDQRLYQDALTISRNDSNGDGLPAMTIWLSALHEGEIDEQELVFQQNGLPITEVIIPAGELSVTVDIATLDDGIMDGNKLISIYAETDATPPDEPDSPYSPGSCWVMVSDLTFPDFVVSNITAPAAPLPGQSLYELEVTISNQGRLDMSDIVPITVAIHASQNGNLTDKTLLLETDFLDGLAVGASATMRLSLEMSMPPADNWRFAAVVNPRNTLREVSFFNNTAWSETFAIAANYRATAAWTPSEMIYSLPGQPLSIRGRTLELHSELPVPYVPVDIKVVMNGIPKLLNAESDADGNFTAVFQPHPGEAGHLLLYAYYPGLENNAIQDELTIIGLAMEKSVCLDHVSKTFAEWQVTANIDTPCSITLRNRSQLPLTSLKAELINAPPGCIVAWNDDGDNSILAELPGQESREVNFLVKGTIPTAGRQYQHFQLKISSEEGAELILDGYYYVRADQAKLLLEPAALDLTMQFDLDNNRGVTRYAEVNLTNTGNDETGEIMINLPETSWMRIVGSDTLESLAPQEETAFLLALTADSSTPLNSPFSGAIAIISGKTNQGSLLPFRVTAVAEGTGSLTVDAIDDFTYYEAHAPHLEGALVIVSNPYTNVELARGITLANGKVTLENLPPGLCKVLVRKDKHADFSAIVEIQPGRDTKQEAFLRCQAITYSWDVVRVEIEDRYDLALTMHFETQVPQPVVETMMPDSIPCLSPGETFAFEVNFFNHGLITAESTVFELGEAITPDCKISFHYPREPFALLPKQSLAIPVLAVGEEMNQLRRKYRSNICESYSGTSWHWLCGNDMEWTHVKNDFSLDGASCSGSKDSGGGEYRPPGDGGGQLIITDEPYVPRPRVDSKRSNYPSSAECNPCLLEMGFNIIKCGVGFIPLLGCATGLTDCAADVGKAAAINHTGYWVSTAIDCVFAGAGCFHPLGNVGSCMTSMLKSCKTNYRSDGEHPSLPAWLAAAQQKLQVVSDYHELYAEYIREIYGAPCWEEVDQEVIRIFAETFFRNAIINGFAVELTAEQQAALLPLLPTEVEPEDLENFVARWNRTVRYWQTLSVDNAPETPVGEPPENYINLQKMLDLASQMKEQENLAKAMGYESIIDLYNKTVASMEKDLADSSSDAVCAKISLRFSQTVTLTREAFEGTLSLFNGHDTLPMQEVKLELLVTDAFGKDCTDLFAIGELPERRVALTAIDGSGNLAPRADGSATVRFIPENDAAPVASKTYFFGGILSYRNPFSNEIASVSLQPVPLEVFPSPRLHIHYFLQRDILGDDPMTEMIEPSYPAELSALVYNVGYGEAKAFRIDSEQPQITHNDKGLLINFAVWDYHLEDSLLNGRPSAAPLGQVNLGTIAPGSFGLAQWWLTSSIQGHFSGMEATYTHLTGNGNPDLCLIDLVAIHELHRSGEDLAGNTVFLTNDLNDSDDLPDTIWVASRYASGTTPEPYPVFAPQEISTPIISFPQNQRCTVTFTVSAFGSNEWIYLRLPAEELQGYEVVNCKRDGQSLPFRNCWLTDRTLPDGKDPIYEMTLHLFDFFATAEPQTYEIEMQILPPNNLDLLDFGGVDDFIQKTALPYVDLYFNKPIHLDTLTSEVLTLRLDGVLVRQELLANLQFSLISEDMTNGIFQYRISNLTDLTSADGFYLLLVQTAGIVSQDGDSGRWGRELSWLKNSGEYTGMKITSFQRIWPEVTAPGAFLVELVFNGEMLPETIRQAGLTLLHDGQEIALTDKIVITANNNGKTFLIDGIYHYAEHDGEYQLIFDGTASGAADRGGNYSNATRTISWNVDRTPPESIVDLHLTADDGISNNDGITWGRTQIIAGTLPEGGLTVEAYYRMTGAATSAFLIAQQYKANDTNLSLPVTLPVDGSIILTIRLLDAAGNFSEQELPIFLDHIPLSVQITDLPDASPQVTRLLCSEPLLRPEDITAAIQLTVNGSEAGIDKTVLTVSPSPDHEREYLLFGLRDCSNVSGNFILRLDLRMLKKQLSGLPGAGTYTASWEMFYPLTEADKAALTAAANCRWPAIDSSGDRYWQIDDTDGADPLEATARLSLRSGSIDKGQHSILSLTVPGPGVLRFYWKVSCSATSDQLAFAVDGTVLQSIRGEQDDWVPVEISLNNRKNYLLTWTFSRGQTAANGQNRGWVDQISYQKYLDVLFNIENKLYDGNTAASRTGDFTVQGIETEHDVFLSDNDACFEFDTPKAGRQKLVSGQNITLAGADADMYLQRLNRARADIIPKPVTATFLAVDKIYDGTTTADIDLNSIDFGDQLVPGDVLTVTAAIGNFAGVHTGTWPVTLLPADCVISNNEDDNYHITFVGDVIATINQRPITGNFVANNKIYDSTPQATVHSFDFDNLVDGEEMAITEYVAYFASANAGIWPVTIDAGYTLTGNEDNNYLLSFAEAQAQIAPKALQIAFTAADKDYDGNQLATVFLLDFNEQLIVAKEVQIEAVTATFSDSRPGIWPVLIKDCTVTGNEQENYTIVFAEDITAEIRYLHKSLSPGWNLMPMPFSELSPESAAIWLKLPAFKLLDNTYFAQRDLIPAFGDCLWIFNQHETSLSFAGIPPIPAPAWNPPQPQNQWQFIAPTTQDYQVPPGIEAWLWQQNKFILIEEDGIIPAGQAALIWW